MNETSISEEFTLDGSELLNGDQYFDGVKQAPEQEAEAHEDITVSASRKLQRQPL